jgi:hypothetical protein
MTPHTVADHTNQSLFVPHPTPLMQFGNTSFPTPPAYNGVTFLADDYFPAGSYFHCPVIEQLAPPTSVPNLQQQSLNFHSLLTTALAMTLDNTPSIMDSVTASAISLRFLALPTAITSNVSWSMTALCLTVVPTSAALMLLAYSWM